MLRCKPPDGIDDSQGELPRTKEGDSFYSLQSRLLFISHLLREERGMF